MQATSDRAQRLARVTVFMACFVLCMLYFVLNPRYLGGRGGTRVSTDLDLSQGWVTEDGTPVDLGSLEKIDGIASGYVRISRHLPDTIEQGIELNYISRNVVFHLLYNNREVFSYDLDVAEEGRTYGAHFNFAPLDPTDAGKEVTLEIHQIYDDSAAFITDMRLSGTTAYIQRYVRRHGIACAMSTLVAFIGLAVLFMGLVTRNQTGGLRLPALGGMLILLGIWTGVETLVPMLITGQEVIIRAAEYMALYFCPCLCVSFFGSLLCSRWQKVANYVAVGILAACVALTFGLTNYGDYDMHQLLFIPLILLASAVLLIVFESVMAWREAGSAKGMQLSRSDKMVLVSFLCVILCAVIDSLTYTLSARATDDSATFVRIGLLVFSVILGYEAFNTSVEYIRLANRTAAVEAMASLDALTGIGNRRAWDLKRGQTNEARAAGDIEDALVLQFDLNFLKAINDTSGHAMGDVYLVHAANMLTHAFGSEGTCYRTGGDEFTVLLEGASLDERLQRCEQALGDLPTEWPEQEGCPIPFSLAWGHALVSETPEATVEAAQLLADERMYQDKRSKKAVRED